MISIWDGIKASIGWALGEILLAVLLLGSIFAIAFVAMMINNMRKRNAPAPPPKPG